MIYSNITKGIFLRRINRFTCEAIIGEQKLKCHIRNTGRLEELLTFGANGIFTKAANSSGRKTEYDLVAIYKDKKLFNIDSSAPNKVAIEYLKQKFTGIKRIKPEFRYKTSRFDFYFEIGSEKYLAEVKGVNYKIGNKALFPVAPTARGVKHIKELIEASQDDYKGILIFVIQFEGAEVFEANHEAHSEFAEILKIAHEKEITILALGCTVKEANLIFEKEVKIGFI